MYADVGRAMGLLIAAHLPWLLSIITVYMTILAGNRSRHAWAIGLGTQGLWLVWIAATGAWGLIPMNVALWIVYTRNHLKWGQGMTRQTAREHVNAKLDRYGAERPNPNVFANPHAAVSLAKLGVHATIVPDHFGDEGLSLAAKRRREEIASYAQ